MPRSVSRNNSQTSLDFPWCPAERIASKCAERPGSRSATAPAVVEVALEAEKVPHPKTAAECVDSLECTLAGHLLIFRHAIEDALAVHSEALQRIDDERQLELAKLRAENANLRRRFDLESTDSGLFQTIALADWAPKPLADRRISLFAEKQRFNKLSPATGGSKSKSVRLGTWTPSLDHIDRSPTSGLSHEPRPCGAWHSFVAWIPDAAALNCPEPWRPLPPACGSSPPELAGDPDASHRMKRGPDMVTHVESPNGGAFDGNMSDKSDDEEESFKVLDDWQVSPEALAVLRRTVSLRASLDRSIDAPRSSQIVPVPTAETTSDTCDEKLIFRYCPHSGLMCTIHPCSIIRAVWDVTSLSLITYDIVMVPMSLFNLPEKDFPFMSWTLRLFWTFDMGMSSCTGVVQPDGSIEMRQAHIWKRYLRSWFLVDLCIVGSDWMELILTYATNMSFFASLSRAFRVVRVMRLLRLVRMKTIMAAIAERTRSDNLDLPLSILKCMLFVLGFSHVSACVWWGLSDKIENCPTWASQYDVSMLTTEGRYLLSLHWTLTQFTGGMDEVHPTNSFERSYAICLWLVGFFATAIIASVLTSTLTRLHIIGGQKERQLATLRKYLSQNNISSKLSLRMQRVAVHSLSADLTPDVVDLLSVVPESLRVEMHFDMYSAVMRSHAFFGELIIETAQLMWRVCHCAITAVVLSSGDIVFRDKEIPQCPRMYFVMKGSFEYETTSTIFVSEKQSVSEAALWTNWYHRGVFIATGNAKLAVLDARTFVEQVQRFTGAKNPDPKLYAADFVAYLNEADEVTDLIIQKGRKAKRSSLMSGSS